MSLINLTPAQLRRAAELKEEIEALEHQLIRLQGNSGEGGRRMSLKRRISAAGIAKIRAAQKARWARVKAARKPGRRGPRTMSAAAKAKISAAAKARWARIHAAAAAK